MRCSLVQIMVIALLTACSAPSASNSPAAEPNRPPALFYAKDGAIFVSHPAGDPGRKLTDGPADTQPAPSPDSSRVAFIRQTVDSDYGGELWVLDLGVDSAPVGPPRRLVDPAGVGPRRGTGPARLGTPRWSPAGDRIAFLEATPTPAGALLTADADTGAVLVPDQPIWVDNDYAWAPDGSRIAWVQGRSDVRAVTVNVAAVDGTSVPVAEGTNASSVSFADGGATVIFANPDTTDSVMFPPDRNPFSLRAGGIYSVPAAGGPGEPALLLGGPHAYGAVTALADGTLAFTETSPRGDSPTSAIKVLPPGVGAAQTIASTTGSAPPAWTRDGVVAYSANAEERSLMIVDRGDGIPRKVDVGVDSFAWAPRP
jgi:TolB protein